jgi:hypothetical protein
MEDTMKRLLLVAALLAPSLAFAADLPPQIVLPVKAPPVMPSLLWYVGLGTEVSTEQANVTGTNLFATSLIGQSGSLQASGGAVTAAVGFINGNPARWSRCQATVAYQNIAGADSAIGTIKSPWSATQECDVGFEWVVRILTALPNLGLTIPAFPVPGLPSTVTVLPGAPKQYVGVIAKESMLSGQFFGAAGSTWAWAPGIATGYIWQTTDATGKANGGMLDGYLNISWDQRGFTASFSGGIGAPTFSGGAKIGTQYTVGLRYDFGVM